MKPLDLSRPKLFKIKIFGLHRLRIFKKFVDRLSRFLYNFELFLNYSTAKTAEAIETIFHFAR